MRLFILTLLASLLIMVVSGCGDSPTRAPGLSRGGGGTNNGGRGMVRQSPATSRNTQRQPSVDLDPFQPTGEDKEKEMPPETETEELFEPESSTATETKKKTELSEDENAIIESLRAEGANIRVIDGHAFSILLNKKNSFSDINCLDLAKLTKIQFLGLSGAKITNSGLERLTVLQDVTSIMLDKTLVTDEVVLSLQKMPKLAHISINKTGMTPEGIQHLQEAFPSTLITGVMSVAKTGRRMSGENPDREPSGPPVFPPGSPEEAVQKFALSLADGKAEGLKDYISRTADKTLLLIRSNKVGKRRMRYFKQTFSKVKLVKKSRISKGRCTIILMNKNNQTLHFSCRMTDGLWRIYKLMVVNVES